MDAKKARERYFLDEMRPIYPDFPEGNVTDSECPDFLIRQEYKTIGIEVTDFIRGQGAGGSPQREDEKLWDMVASKARAEYEQTSDVPVDIRFLGGLRRTLTFPIVQKLASETAQLVLQHIPRGLFESIELTNEEMEGTALSEFISRVRILRVRNKGQALWASIRAGWTGAIPNEIQSLVSMKDVKVQDYLKNCDEVWLVIVAEADALYISSHITSHENLARHTFTCQFNRALLYDRIERKVIPLNISVA